MEVDLAGPILCFYYLTYRCNARCSFCDIYKRKTTLADPAMVEDHLRQLKPLGIRFIDFTGGEPLLHPDLPELLKKAGDSGFHTSVTTNCILYPKIAEDLRGLVDLLHFSLDSAQAEQHDSIRGVNCFDKVMESIETAVDLKEKPDILMTVTPDNFDQIEKVHEIAARNKLMLILNPVFEYLAEDGPDRELADKLLKLRRKKFLYNNTAFLKLMMEGGNRTESSRCKAVSATVVISPEGDLLLPCFHHAVECVNLGEGIKAARKTTVFKRALQKQGKYDFCAGCTINCYFDPSFVYTPDSLFFRSLMAKTKYAVDKYLTA